MKIGCPRTFRGPPISNNLARIIAHWKMKFFSFFTDMQGRLRTTACEIEQ